MRYLTLIIFSLAVVSCTSDTDPKLPSVEERTAVAIDDLLDELTSPANGWRIDYRPTSQTGSFFILMDFDEDGTVRIQSDIVANDGEFRDQSILYRIDSSQGIELILETYGVFHYLFELNRASFGGEFEFLFVEEDGGNLVFSSKSDQSSDITRVVLEPAGADDASLISTSVLSALSEGAFQTVDLGGVGSYGNFNLYFPSSNHTLSINFDLDGRKMNVLGIAEGASIDEINSAANGLSLNQSVLFRLEEDRLILDQPMGISFDGTNYSLSEIPVRDLTKSLESFCASQMDSVAHFSATNVTGIGDFIASSSLFQTHNGIDYSGITLGINHNFLYDENDNSIEDDIEAVFPQAVAFQWYYGLELGDSTLNVVGFVTLDQFNNADFFLRGFDFVRNGNFVELTFNGKDLFTVDEPTTEQIDGLYQLTDDIFSGGGVYMLSISTLDELVEFYNPCNKYKGFLF